MTSSHGITISIVVQETYASMFGVCMGWFTIHSSLEQGRGNGHSSHQLSSSYWYIKFSLSSPQSSNTLSLFYRYYNSELHQCMLLPLRGEGATLVKLIFLTHILSNSLLPELIGTLSLTCTLYLHPPFLLNTTWPPSTAICLWTILMVTPQRCPHARAMQLCLLIEQNYSGIASSPGISGYTVEPILFPLTFHIILKLQVNTFVNQISD